MSATTNININNQKDKPWYKEPWPWLLMAGPFIVIVAGLWTAWLAVSSSDGLVADDYYKQGLAAGETLVKSRKAEDLNITAGLRMTSDTIQIRLSASREVQTRPDSLHVALSHPTRAGLDQNVVLKRSGDEYVGDFHLPASGHWLVLIEDDAKTWRLMGSILLPVAGETVIGGGVGATAK